MTAIRFKDLLVWQKAYALALRTFRLTKRFPSDERFRLTDQMCRAASSIPVNIAEGFPKQTGREQAHYYMIAKSSLEELRVHFMFARDLGYVADISDLEQAADEVGAMLYVLRERVLGR